MSCTYPITIVSVYVGISSRRRLSVTGFPQEKKCLRFAQGIKDYISTNLYYLSNPRESNGVLTRNGSQEFSCPDQYAARLGLTFSDMKTGLAAYFGGRLEGVPSSDLLGSSAGYRRPGFVASLEPGISLPLDRLSLSLNVPFAIHKNRTQSYDDKRITAETGIYRHGDAAFANYLINFNVGYYIGRNKSKAIAKYLEI